MWNEPATDQLAKIPGLYETEHVPLKEKLIHFHFFIGGCDWLIAEYDGQDLMWGFAAILNNNLQCAEWGYISFSELKNISIHGIEVDYDIYWTPCPANQVQTICKAHGWTLKQPNKLMANMTA